MQNRALRARQVPTATARPAMGSNTCRDGHSDNGLGFVTLIVWLCGREVQEDLSGSSFVIPEILNAGDLARPGCNGVLHRVESRS